MSVTLATACSRAGRAPRAPCAGRAAVQGVRRACSGAPLRLFSDKYYIDFILRLHVPVCKFKAHKRCAVRATNNCKWTTLASIGKDIIEDEDGVRLGRP